jgi:hypothetical protein
MRVLGLECLIAAKHSSPARLSQWSWVKTDSLRDDEVKRRVMRQSLGAVIDFLMAQPNWSAADSALLVKLGEALADVERGRATSLLSSKPSHHPPTPPGLLSPSVSCEA